MPARHLPTRSLPQHPDLDQLKRQAKELLGAFQDGTAEAVAEVHAHFRPETIAAGATTFALHDAQLVLARAYGFESWPKLKAHVDGATVQQLAEAVRANDLEQVRSLLGRRPELARIGVDNLSVVHFAVLNRAPDMVRLLMEHGASPREGVYPHRDATSALTLAIERGDTEIVGIIEDVERQRREAQSGRAAPPPEALFGAITAGAAERAIGMMAADPALIHTCHPLLGWTPLHLAAKRLDTAVVRWLLERGADPARRGWHDVTPLDMAAHFSDAGHSSELASVARLLLDRGAEMTPWAAAALGDAAWLRARHAAGMLTNNIEDTGGLLRIAASHNRPEILELLLDFKFDPDERTRFGNGDDVVFTWGMPLWHCASTGRHAMAETLLRRGADPNASVYASGTPLYQAYSRADRKMIALLERYGGRPDATVAGLYRRRDLAKQLIDREASTSVHDGIGTGQRVAEELLWPATCGGDPEIVRMALAGVDWSRDDRRWFSVLEQAIRFSNDGTEPWAEAGWDRRQYLTCFRLLLDRCDPNLRGRSQDNGRFGLTILHSVVAARPHVTAAERLAFATMLLDAGAHLDVRDNLLQSTPLGWACRWGRLELVTLFLERRADPVEAGAEPWARPLAWASRHGHGQIVQALRAAGAG
jgi:ankyrin repeat protein